MNISLNLDLFAAGVAIAASVILGFVFFFKDTKNRIGRLFLLFTLANVGWIAFNYLSYRVSSYALTLQSIRLIMFFAIMQTLFYFLLMQSFSKEGGLDKKEKYFYLPLMAAAAGLTLTPLVFSGLAIGASGNIPQPVPGPAISLFGMMAIYSVYKGSKAIYQKMLASEDRDRLAFKYLLIGALLMFSSIIVFSFVLPTLFENTRFIPLSAVFTLPFVFFTGYAIIRHNLLRLKIVSTETLVFFLAIGSLLEIFFSESLGMLLFRIGLFILILSIGVLLIKSVLKEIRQKEELKELSTQLAKANDQLKTLDQARAEFISIASHQLRTPPATTKWYLSSVLSGDYGRLGKEVRQALLKTERVNNELISLIEDLLNVSRIERGKLEFLFEPVDLSALAKAAFEQLSPIAQEKKLGFEFIGQKNTLPKIMADKEKIRQVMNNLMENAIKYTPSGSIQVSLDSDGDQLIFRVKDTGKGVSAEEAAEIFQKFTRGKDSLKHSAGLGLGLYVAKIVIQQHKGRLWVESPGPGQGSTFIFAVPIRSGLTATTIFDLAPNRQ